MKRILTFLLALVFCLTLAIPAFAAVDVADDVDQKPTPGIVTAEDGTSVAIVYDAEGNELLRLNAEELIATAIVDFAGSNLSEEAKNDVLNAISKFENPDAYLSIQAPEMNEVAIDILGTHNTADSFSVWHMFDLSVYNDKVLELLAQEGTYVEVTFDLGDNAAEVIAAMVYSMDKWFDAELVNNGDGTVTCKFNCFGVVSFLIPVGAGGEQGEQTDPDQDLNDPNEDEDFVPSIGYKPLPGLAPDADGNVGGIVDPNGNIDSLKPDCFSFVSVNETEKPHGTLSEQERVLRSVFNVMNNPNVKLSKVAPAMNEVAEKLLGVGYTADDFVIRDLFYMDFVCPEHSGMLPAEGVKMDLAFDLGLAPDDIITGMVFIEGEWVPLEAVNNGDDTATFTFVDVCPVAFLVPKDQNTSASAGIFASSFFNPQVTNAPAASVTVEATGADNGLWMITGTVSIIAAAALMVVLAKSKKRENA